MYDYFQFPFLRKGQAITICIANLQVINSFTKKFILHPVKNFKTGSEFTELKLLRKEILPETAALEPLHVHYSSQYHLPHCLVVYFAHKEPMIWQCCAYVQISY